MSVQAILNEKGREVFSIGGDISLEEVCRLLSEYGIGALPVTDERGHLDGIISERDIVKTVSRLGSGALAMQVSGVMTRAVVTCEEHENALAILGRMTTGRFRHMPVTDGGRLIGMISIGDVVKFRIAQIEQEAENMRSYIAMA